MHEKKSLHSSASRTCLQGSVSSFFRIGRQPVSQESGSTEPLSWLAWLISYPSRNPNNRRQLRKPCFPIPRTFHIQIIHGNRSRRIIPLRQIHISFNRIRHKTSICANHIIIMRLTAKINHDMSRHQIGRAHV